MSSSRPTTKLNQDEILQVLSGIFLTFENEEVVEGLDEDMMAYLAGMLSESHPEDSNAIRELVGPFLEGFACPDKLVEDTCQAVAALLVLDSKNSSSQQTSSGQEIRRLKQGLVSMSSDLEKNGQTDAELDANRHLWGIDSTMINEQIDAHATSVSSKEKRKQKQELERVRRDYQETVRQQQEAEQDNHGAAVSTMVLPNYNTSGNKERDVLVRNVSLSLDNGRILLDHAELKFAYRRRYGLVGKNGIGKTTLLKAIANLGDIEGFPMHLRVLHVRQEVQSIGNNKDDDTKPVLQAVLEADVERLALLKQEEELTTRLEQQQQGEDGPNINDVATPRSVQEKRERLLRSKQKQPDDDSSSSSFDTDLKKLEEVYARLQVLSADSAEARAAMILSGLQFTPEMQAGPISALSGGWRMRVALAAALFIEPDILMLDEPTNHLDLEAVLWLESYLVEYKHTLVVVSHDRGFLNEVCTDIMEFKNQTLTYYRGNYDTYVKTSEEIMKNSMRVYHAYLDKRNHMMEFIEKFRANAKRATMVQSRIKAMEKMDLEAPDPIEMEPVWRFSIPNPEPLGIPIIAVDDVSFDYNVMVDGETKKPESEFLLQKVNFGVDLDSRIGILGANGAGKSTLLNLIMGKLEPVRGSLSRNGRLRIGHFTQHSADKFDLQLSSVENMLAIFPNAGGDQEMRSFLGRFQIQGSDALKPMLLLSGGQKSRVAFATLAYQKPHVIIMDEPTNHLDMESIDALVEAIKDFRGGLMVVSHDQFFITHTCSELWVVGDGKATRFRGDFDEYKKHTLEKTAKRVADSVKSLSRINS